MRRRFRVRLGRRGVALLAFAYLDIIIGYSLLDPVVRQQTEAIPSYRVIVAIAPLLVWAVIWLVAGAACALTAFMPHDKWGFAATSGVMMVWAFGIASAWIAYDAYRGWLAAATWFVLALLVLDISGWREVPRD